MGLVLRAALMICEPKLPPPVDPSEATPNEIARLDREIAEARAYQEGFQWEADRFFFEAQRLSIDTPDLVEGRQYYEASATYEELAMKACLRAEALEAQRAQLLCD
jgi:hypothetical protein